jgi:hypothetical protein
MIGLSSTSPSMVSWTIPSACPVGASSSKSSKKKRKKKGRKEKNNEYQ